MRIAVPLALTCAFTLGTPTWPAQDLSGGVGIFTRPANPPVNHSKMRSARSRQDGAAARTAPRTAQKALPAPAASEAQEQDTVNDALWLGNSARDNDPPRYEEAARAYRLAAKLAPTDPRPHIGLGNIFFDQGKHADAARAFKTAAELAISAGARPVRPAPAKPVPISRQKGRSTNTVAAARRVRPDTPPQELYVRANVGLGLALLRAGMWKDAEGALRYVTNDDPFDAEPHAMLGLALMNQGKYRQAEAAFTRVIKIATEFEDEETIAEYKKLLRQARQGRVRKAPRPSSARH
jgi:Flp pilus assembly protein TadD